MDLAHVGALRSSFVDNFYVELDRFWTQHDSTSQPIFQHPCNFVAFDTKSKVCFRPGSPPCNSHQKESSHCSIFSSALHVFISDCCREVAKVCFYMIFTAQSILLWGALELWNGDLARTTDGSTRVTKSLWQDMAPIHRSSMGVVPLY